MEDLSDTSNHVKQAELAEARNKGCDAAETCQRNRENWGLTLAKIKDNQKQTDWVWLGRG